MEHFDRIVYSYRYNIPWFAKLKIVASNDINEDTILSLNEQGHKIDCFGIGTHLGMCSMCSDVGHRDIKMKGQRLLCRQSVITVRFQWCMRTSLSSLGVCAGFRHLSIHYGLCSSGVHNSDCIVSNYRIIGE